MVEMDNNTNDNDSRGGGRPQGPPPPPPPPPPGGPPTSVCIGITAPHYSSFPNINICVQISEAEVNYRWRGAIEMYIGGV